MLKTFFKSNLFFLILGLILSLAYRIPYLINSDHMNSDHAIFGLQAIHFLKNEWSLFLWKCFYQGVVEQLIAAVFFKILGTNFFVLALVPLVGFLLGYSLIFLTLNRKLNPFHTFLLTLPLIVGSKPFIQTSILPFRQWSLLFSLIPVYLLTSNKKTSLKFSLAAFCIPFSLYIDFFTIVFIPSNLILLFLSHPNKKEKRGLILGLLSGATFLFTTRFFAEEGAPLAFSFKTVLSNIPLFFKICLPVLFGITYPAEKTISSIHSLTDFIILIFGIFYIAILFFGSYRSWRNKQIFPVYGATLALITIFGFLGSSMASDVYSSRYLITLFYAAPFCLYFLIQQKKYFISTLQILLAIIIGIGGWKQAAPFTDSYKVVRDPGQYVATVKELKSWLEKNNIKGGYANYWDSYSLTFLFGEEIIITPTSNDRYPAYTEKVKALPQYALISTPREDRKDRSQNPDWEMNGFRVTLIKLAQ